MLKKNKKLLFTIVIIILILLIFFTISEIFTRIIVGKRLIPEIESNDLYYFKPNQEGWYSHSLAIPHARINNIGARGEDVDIDLLNTNRKYIFLGDSMTFGWAVRENETMAYYFMKEMGLNNNQILNYGMGGFSVNNTFNMEHHYSNFFNKGDTAIVTFIEDDFYRINDIHQTSTIKGIFWKIREHFASIAWIWENSKHARGVIMGENKTAGLRKEDIFNKDKDSLIKFKEDLKKKGIDIVYIFYEYNYTNYSKEARYFCKENGLKCITDIPESVDTIRNEGKDILSVDRGHPSKELNKEVAERMAKFINNTYFLRER